MKPEIFLVHGWNMPPVVWGPIAQQLANRFKITLAAMPGYSSDNSPPDSIDSEQDPLKTVMDSLLEQAPPTSHWVGWSLGATVAMACAIEHPSRMDRLTLISPTPCFTLRPDWELGYDQKSFLSLLKITQRRFDLGAKNFLTLQSLGEHLQQTFTDVCNHRPTDAALKQGFNILCQSDLRSQITNIKTPTQIIAAATDNVIPPPASHWVAQAIPHSTLQTLGAGHGTPITNAQEISNLIASFSTGSTQ